MSDTLFDKLVRGDIPSRIVWQDDNYLAFLTPIPNTPGATVVIPKINQGDDAFELTDEQLTGLMLAAKKVAQLLKKAFEVKRVALVVEGTGVAYVHAKLYPLHGELGGQTNVWGKETDFTEEYRGYITTQEGPAMEDAQLDEIKAKIIAASK